MAYSMTCRTKSLAWDPEEEFVHRAVRNMAIGAVLTHRRVFEQEWSAFLGVTLVAIVVDRIAAQHGLRGAAVRIVAVRASDLTFA